jgi:hypothetical protein
MIELHLQGTTTLFPLTLDKRHFDSDGEVNALARRLPVRGHGRAELPRVFGSLPVDDLSTLRLAELRSDLELVQAAWHRAELAYAGA